MVKRNRGSLNWCYTLMYMHFPRRVRQRWAGKGWGRWSHTYLNISSQIFNVSECYYVEEYFVPLAFGPYYREFSSVLVIQHIQEHSIPVCEAFLNFNLYVNKIFGLPIRRLFITKYVFHVISPPGSAVNCRVAIHFSPMKMNGAIWSLNTIHLFFLIFSAVSRS